MSAWPAQSVNYVESHDDMCWMDRITINQGSNATRPAPEDRRRTHLMVSILMMSLGIPMISAGQDFLRSKQGNNNTYKRGDINALDYGRLRHFSGTHEYFRKWIEFRRSPAGGILRLMDKPGTGYLRFVFAEGGSSALGAMFNADGELGPTRLFYAVNPSGQPCRLILGDLSLEGFRQIADTECFDLAGLKGGQCLPFDAGGLDLPPMSCALWIV
jgi:hypothetical protein